MNRSIKFRGVEFFSKKFIYGQTIRETEDGFDMWTGDDWLHCTDIAQFVGFDRDGAEVYEGDVLIDELEQEYTAEIYDRPEKIHALKLKEAQS